MTVAKSIMLEDMILSFLGTLSCQSTATGGNHEKYDENHQTGSPAGQRPTPAEHTAPAYCAAPVYRTGLDGRMARHSAL
jgi:hypothetical protein